MNIARVKTKTDFVILTDFRINYFVNPSARAVNLDPARSKGQLNMEKIIFSFLKTGVEYSANIYSDDQAINTRTHVRIDSIDIDRNTVYSAKFGSNKGIALHIKPAYPLTP